MEWYRHEKSAVVEALRRAARVSHHDGQWVP
jgi:hypothetical protein